jgi:hypothetical protein
MANNIFARSPYIIEVNEIGQAGSKIEIFLWNSGSAPIVPQHKLSKPIPSLTKIQTTYNISPYIREFINHNTWQTIYNTTTDTPNKQWCNVKVKRYKLAGGVYTLLDTTTYFGFDGYGYYEEGYNINLGQFMLTEGTYYYHYDENATIGATQLDSAGHFTLERTGAAWLEWTNLRTGAQTSVGLTPLTGSAIKDTFRVYPLWYADGNKLKVLNSSFGTLAEYVFKPIHECRNEVFVCDFVNKFGAWQREFFFGASNERIESTATTYNLLQTDLVDYDVREGQRKEFNANGIKSITLNTGIRDESMNEPLQQLMLSERILLNGLPVKLRSRQLAKLKMINQKIINYSVEFEYANDIINSVV